MLFDTDVLIWYLRGNSAAADLLDQTASRQTSVGTNGASNQRMVATACARARGADIHRKNAAVTIASHFQSHRTRWCDLARSRRPGDDETAALGRVAFAFFTEPSFIIIRIEEDAADGQQRAKRAKQHQKRRRAHPSD